MLKKLKEKLAGTEEKKRLAENILTLGVLQFANYLLPLFTAPYLLRVLGPEYFGLLAFASATIMYFMLLSDYGFNLSATRQISIHRDDIDKVSEIFSSVMIIKIIILILSFGLMMLLIFCFAKFKQHWEVYLLTYGMVIGQVLFPIWLFQGLERMKYITYFNVGARVFFTALIFILVQDKSDYLKVPLVTSLGYIVTGIWSLCLVKKEFGVRIYWQNKDTLKFHLVEGWHVFFSSMAISLYTISNNFILGLFANYAAVGYYAAADKIVQAVKGLYQPVAQAIYPVIAKKIHDNKPLALIFIRKITWIVGAVMLVISSALFLLAEQVVNILIGQQYKQSIIILKIMSFLPLIVALSNIYGIQTMLNLGYKKAFSYILVAAAVLGLGLSLLLVPRYEGFGTATALLVVEVFVTIVMYLYLKIKTRIFK